MRTILSFSVFILAMLFVKNVNAQALSISFNPSSHFIIRGSCNNQVTVPIVISGNETPFSNCVNVNSGIASTITGTLININTLATYTLPASTLNFSYACGVGLYGLQQGVSGPTSVTFQLPVGLADGLYNLSITLDNINSPFWDSQIASSAGFSVTAYDIYGVSHNCSYTFFPDGPYTGHPSCTVNNFMQINIADPVTPLTISSITSGVGLCGVYATVNPTGGVPPYTYLWNNVESSTIQTPQFTHSGTYTVTVTDASNCAVSQSITTPNFSYLAASVINITNPTPCIKGTATALATGGTPPYSYLWGNGETTVAAVNLNGPFNGENHLVVTDANNCSVTVWFNLQIVAENFSVPHGILFNPHLEDHDVLKPTLWYATKNCADPLNLTGLQSCSEFSSSSTLNFFPGDGCKGTDLPMNTTLNIPTYFAQLNWQDNANIPPIISNTVYMMEVRIKTDNTEPALTTKDYDIDLISELTNGTRWSLKKVYSLGSAADNTYLSDWKVYQLMFSTEKYYPTQKLQNIGFRFFTGDSHRSSIMAHVDGIVLDNAVNITSPDGSHPYQIQNFTAGTSTSTGSFLGNPVTFYERTINKLQFSNFGNVQQIFHFEQFSIQQSLQQPSSNLITRYNYNDGNDVLIMGNIVLQPYTHLNIVSNASVIFGHNTTYDVYGKLWLGTGSALTVSTGGTLKYENGEINFLASNAGIAVQGGTLQIAQGKILQINTGYVAVTPNSTFDFKTGSTLALDAGGILSLLSGTAVSPNIITIGAGSTLKIGKRGRLELNDNTKLIIGTGAKLVYEEGSQIVLSGNNSILEIRGTIQIADNTTFTFTGNGQIDFTNTDASTPNILAGTNSKFILNGTGNNDMVISIGANAMLWPQDDLRQFTITNAKVSFNNAGIINLGCRYVFNHVNFENGFGKLIVWRTVGSIINNCNFDWVSIEGNLNACSRVLRIQNTTIQNSNGLRTIGAGVSLSNVHFINCFEAWHQEAMTLPSSLLNCSITGTEVFENGIWCQSAAASLSLTNTNIIGAEYISPPIGSTGIYAEGPFSLNIRCCKVDNFYYGLHINGGCNLNMSVDLGNGYNDFSNNSYPVRLDAVASMNIDDGYNSFGNNNLSRLPTYPPAIFGTIINAEYPYIISANNNQWFRNSEGSPIAVTSVYYSGIYISVNDDTPHMLATCGSKDNPPTPSNSNMLRVCATCTNITTPHFNNIPYNEAVRIAISNMEIEDSTKNDLTAISMFKEILLYPANLNDQSIRWLSKLAFEKMNIALTNAFANERITAADNVSSLHPSVQEVLDIYAHFAATPTQNNYLEQFYLDYTKAQICRLAGRYDLALTYFNNISNCYIGNEEIRQLNNAKIITNAEQLVTTGQVSQLQFTDMLKALTPPVIKQTIIDSTANVNNTAVLGENVKIGTNTTIEQGVIIGNNVTIGNNVSIKKETTIKDGVTIGNNTVIEKGNIIGADNIIGNNVIIKKECVLANNVTLSDNAGLDENSKIGGFVTIGFNTKLQKEAFIADGTSIGANGNFDKSIKLGSNVTILDNANVKKEVQIGDRTFIGSNVTINQSAKIGSDVTINNSLTIGSNARISNNKTITTNVANNGQVGTTAPTIPAIPGQVVFNCTFAQANAKVRGNLFYGFTATNENTGILSFGTGDAIKFKANNLSLNYLWNFGDCTTSTEQIPTHTYTKPGVYVITLTETIKCTQIIYTGAITVYPAPDATFTNQQQPLCSASNKYLLNKSNNVGDLHTILFNCQAGLCSNDPTGLDSSFYRVKYHWNFGLVKPAFDETFTLKQIYKNIDSNITCTFPQAGSYPVSLSATLEVKNKSTNIWTATDITKVYTDTIHVGDHIMADFDFTQPACFNDSVYFTDKTQYGKKPYTYSWSFAFHNGSTFANPIHKYATAGIFNISLIATDAIGCKDTAIKQIIIPACPSIFGTIYENEDCGGSPVVGDTIILKDNFSNIVSTVTPAITNSNGEFNFSSNEIQLLDTTALYILSTKSGFELQNITAKSISQWKTISPMSINLKNVNQEWVASYSGILAIYNMATAIDINDNVCVTGTTYGVSNTYDYSTLKYDKDGHLLWTKIYNGIGNGEDRAIGIVIDNNSNIYVSGYSWGGSNMDWATVKYDPSGNVIWVARYNGTGNDYDVPSAMVLDDLGNIYITGSSVGSNSIFDYLTVKYDANGVEQWVSRYDAPTANGLNFARDIKVDNLGNTYITGENGAVGMVEYCTVKYDVNGAQIWVQKYSGQGGGDSHASQLVLDKNNDVYVTGTSSEGGANTNYTTIKYSASGVEQWIKHYNGANNGAVVSAMGIDSDDDIIISGMILQVNPPNNIYNYLTVKYDKNGIEKWTKTFEPSLDNLVGPSSLKVDNSDNIYIAGSVATGATMDYATIKYDKNGELIWSQKFNGVGNGSDGAYDIALSQSNNVYVTGYSWNGNNQDYVTIKYSQCPATASVLRYSNPAYNTESSEDETQILNSKPVVSNAEPSQILNKSEYVNMFPNPNDGNFYFNYSLPENEKCQFTVFDPTSKKVYSIEIKGGKNTVMVNHNNFSNGVYYYQVTAGNRLIKTERLVIAK